MIISISKTTAIKSINKLKKKNMFTPVKIVPKPIKDKKKILSNMRNHRNLIKFTCQMPTANTIFNGET